MADGTDPNKSMNDPMNLRNTDTAKLKRIDPSDEPKPSVHGRKTLRLKPIGSKTSGAQPSEAAPPVPSASSVPVQEPEPVFMEEEESAPVVEEDVVMPADSAVENAAALPTPTVVINRVKKSTVSDSPTANIPPVADSPVTSVPGAKQTIKLRPSTTATPSPVNIPGITDGAAKPASTISSMPDSAKQTIKLVPSSKPGTAVPSASTIKLTPKGATPAPSSATIKLTAKPGTPDSAVTPVPAAAPTVNTEASAAEKARIKKSADSAAPAVSTGDTFLGQTEAEASEPSILFTVSAVVALLVLISSTVLFSLQYFNLWI